MRGKVQQHRRDAERAGITPAYAGKSRHLRVVGKQPKDHPRLCGEKFYLSMSQNHHIGSPPPMRGKAFRVDRHRTAERITPAYAGKSKRKRRARRRQ